MRVISSVLFALSIVGTKSQDSVPSAAPSSEFPSFSELPSSEFPSYPNKQSHSYVKERLYSVFGEENCIQSELSDTRRLNCSVEASCFSASAEYDWYFDPTEEPKYLSIQYGYSNGSSGRSDTDFSDESYFPDEYFDSISRLLFKDEDCDSKGPSREPTVAPTRTPTQNPTSSPTAKPTKRGRVGAGIRKGGRGGASLRRGNLNN